jgi:hypothetical protein
MTDFSAHFDQGLPYQQFLDTYGTDEHRRRWGEVFDRVQLSETQHQLLSSFKREMKVLCLAGAWCGDCVEQCPILQHFSLTAPIVRVRFVDRDADKDLQAELSLCGGARVPVVVMLSEDGFELSRMGDRTLSKYRRMAVDQLGPSCPTGIVPPPQSLLDAVTQDWLDELERVQLMLRLSPRLRERHGD